MIRENSEQAFDICLTLKEDLFGIAIEDTVTTIADAGKGRGNYDDDGKLIGWSNNNNLFENERGIDAMEFYAPDVNIHENTNLDTPEERLHKDAEKLAEIVMNNL